MSLLTLKNGAQEPRENVITTMLSLKNLMETRPMVFYDLVKFSRDSSYRISPGHLGTLESLSLLSPEGGVNSSVRNVVLSAVEGEGLDMQLRSPVDI